MSPLVVPGVILGGLVLIASSLPSPSDAANEADALASVDAWIGTWSPAKNVGTVIWNGITYVPRAIGGWVEGAAGDAIVSWLTSPTVVIVLAIGGYLVFRHSGVLKAMLL